MQLPPHRITGRTGPALLPRTGPVRALIYAEAPGPLGADKSGIPFLGDKAGAWLYRALLARGYVTFEQHGRPLPLREALHALRHWSGQDFVAQGVVPVLREVGLSNAYPACPTNNGTTFREPSAAELRDPTNLGRIRAELAAAASRNGGVAPLVVCLGGPARRVFGHLRHPVGVALCHCSPQGVLMGCRTLLPGGPRRGKGIKRVRLHRLWRQKLAASLP